MNFNLERFVTAQNEVMKDVEEELLAGDKQSHWMWFVFPQVKGLGFTHMSEYYGIGSLQEAKGYLSHPKLRGRLIRCCEILLNLKGRTAREIFGFTDEMKLKSSMTLFATVSEDRIFQDVLNKYFDGERDINTLKIMKIPLPQSRTSGRSEESSNKKKGKISSKSQMLKKDDDDSDSDSDDDSDSDEDDDNGSDEDDQKEKRKKKKKEGKEEEEAKVINEKRNRKEIQNRGNDQKDQIRKRENNNTDVSDKNKNRDNNNSGGAIEKESSDVKREVSGNINIGSVIENNSDESVGKGMNNVSEVNNVNTKNVK